MTTEVFITRTSAYLPFEPVSNQEIEDVLGMIGGRPSRARQRVLRSNGIEQRHYAIDRQTGEPAMSNAQLTAEAIRGLGDVGKVDCLAAATSMPDQLMPGHAVMVHNELGWSKLEALSFAGICLSGIAALKYAWLAVRAGGSERAIATASELASPILLARHFDAEAEHKLKALDQRPEIAFEKDFLRWMLSDGAGAMLLENQPRGTLSLRIDWIKLTSAANEYPVCMYQGAEKDGDERLRGWLDMPPADWSTRSVFTVKQDVRLLNDNIQRAMAESLREVVQEHDLHADRIDWFLPHMSSHFFMQAVRDGLADAGLPIPQERWFSNLTTKGNTGSASPYIMLDELFRSGRIKPGHKILMLIPESGRFSSGFVMMEAV